MGLLPDKDVLLFYVGDSTIAGTEPFTAINPAWAPVNFANVNLQNGYVLKRDKFRVGIIGDLNSDFMRLSTRQGNSAGLFFGCPSVITKLLREKMDADQPNTRQLYCLSTGISGLSLTDTFQRKKQTDMLRKSLSEMDLSNMIILCYVTFGTNIEGPNTNHAHLNRPEFGRELLSLLDVFGNSVGKIDHTFLMPPFLSGIEREEKLLAMEDISVARNNIHLLSGNTAAEFKANTITVAESYGIFDYDWNNISTMQSTGGGNHYNDVVIAQALAGLDKLSSLYP